MFAARQGSKYEVVSSAPSVNLTKMSVPVGPVPYPVSIKLTPSDAVVPYVFFNGKKVYVKRSTTTEVKGDEKGGDGGVVSGTVGGEAVAIVFAPKIKVDGSNLVRVGDLYNMQSGNTKGKLTTTEGGDGGSIGADGSVESSPPADASGSQGASAWDQALNALKDPMGAYAKLQDMKSKYDTVAGMINGDIPFSAAGLAGAVGGLTGNQSLMQASSMLSKAETAKKMLDGDIPFSPAFAMGLAGSATGNPGLMQAAQTVGQAEGYYNKVDHAYDSGGGRTPSFNPSSGKGHVHSGSSPKQGATPSFNPTPKPTATSLTNMIKSDTVKSFGKTLLGAMSSSEKPTASMAMSGLGSLMGSPVLLATAQSIYHYSFPPLLGALSIDLNITYVSDTFYEGLFGTNRRHSYEKQFYELKGNNYRLDLADGRWFRFIKQEDGTFKDVGSLGIKVKQIDEESFELYYLKTATKEYYHKKYLRVVEDSNGNSIEFSYKKTNNPKIELLEKIENSSKSSWKFVYNEDNLVKELKDHASRVWTFNYSSEKNLKYISLNKEIEESYGYEYIERENLPKQYLLSQVSDALERQQLHFTYNQRGEVTGYSQKEQSYRYIWHSLEQVEKQNGSENSIIYGLDESKRVTAITYPDGSYVQEDWDNEKQVATIRTRGGSELIKSYDEQGRLLSVVEDEELVEKFTYEKENPKPISHIKNEKTTEYKYDKAFNLIELILANKVSYSYSYTKEGLRSSSVDALGYETLYEYSPEATLIKEIDAQKNETKVLYDKLGRVVLVTLADQTKHQYGYNLANQITLYKNPLDEKIEFSYSKTGKLLSLRDPAKRKTEFKYDEYDRVIVKTTPFLEIEEMEQEHYSYNPDSTLSTITRVDGSKLYLNYDLNQNITTIIAQSKSGEVEELKYGYDELSNLTKAIAKQSSVVLDYDENAQLSKEEQNGIELHTLYDEKSRELNQLNFLDQTLSYAYDDVANVKSIEINQSSKIEFKYDNNGLLTKRAYPNKTKECYEYDELKSISEIKSSKTKISYGHNEVGDIRYKLNHEDEDATSYRYNGRNELIQAGREEFNYNRAGNRVKEGWEYNYKNQLTQTPKYIYDYDERGNLKSKIDKRDEKQTLYTFNLFNQLLSVKKQNKNQESIEEFHYRYDALNRRVKKTTLKGTTQTTHHYLYNGHNIVAILDNNKKTLATIVHDKTIDTPLSITTYQNPLRELTEVEESYYHELPKAEKEFIDQKRKSRTYYYNRDHQGSIHNLTNEAGKIVESFRYDESYGTITKQTKTEETLNPYCYTGREFESDELYYYRARYYDPTIGRFISSDPIEFLAGDFNFYRYVGNEPVGWVDPMGLAGTIRPPVPLRNRNIIRNPNGRQVRTPRGWTTTPPSEERMEIYNRQRIEAQIRIQNEVSSGNTGYAEVTNARPYTVRPSNPLDSEPNPVFYPRNTTPRNTTPATATINPTSNNVEIMRNSEGEIIYSRDAGGTQPVSGGAVNISNSNTNSGIIPLSGRGNSGSVRIGGRRASRPGDPPGTYRDVDGHLRNEDNSFAEHLELGESVTGPGGGQGVVRGYTESGEPIIRRSSGGTYFNNPTTGRQENTTIPRISNTNEDSDLPYANHRPSYRQGVVESVWRNNQTNDEVISPEGEVLTWNRDLPRNGQWDMGHRPGYEYHRSHGRYMRGEMTREEFLNEYNTVDNYRPESINYNRSHQGEIP